MNHNRTTALERSVLNYQGGGLKKGDEHFCLHFCMVNVYRSQAKVNT